MITFMFGVLGSAVFWGFYIITSFVIGSTLLKYWERESYNFIIGEGPNPEGNGDVTWFVIFIGLLLFWPVVFVWKIFCFIAKEVLWPIFQKSIKASAKIIPEIVIKKSSPNESSEG